MEMFKQKKEKPTRKLKVVTNKPQVQKKEPDFDLTNPSIGLEDEAIFGSATHTPANSDRVGQYALSPRCPIFYDDNGKLMCVPQPHDVAIETLRNTLLVFESDNGAGSRNGYYTDYGLIRENIGITISNAYRDAIANASVSYLSDRLCKNYTYTAHGDIQDFETSITGIQTIITNSVFSGLHTVNYVISGLVRDLIQLEYSDLDLEEANRTTFYLIENATNHIMSALAVGLNQVIMSLTFDKSVGLSDDYERCKQFNRKDYLKDLSEESYEGKPISPQLFYFLQSCEFTCQLNGMVGMINGLCYQARATIKYVLSTSPKFVQINKKGFKEDWEHYAPPIDYPDDKFY